MSTDTNQPVIIQPLTAVISGPVGDDPADTDKE